MSTTTGSRVRNDDYPSPLWTVDRYLDRVADTLPRGRWLELSAGSGNVIRAVRAHPVASKLVDGFDAVEIDEAGHPELRDVADRVIYGDALKVALATDYAVCIGNPPYELALEFLKRGVQCASVVALLLRANFVGSAERAPFFATHMPNAYRLPDRPTFVVKVRQDPKTGRYAKTSADNSDYDWTEIRRADLPRRRGTYELLDPTPVKERSAAKRQAPIVKELDDGTWERLAEVPKGLWEDDRPPDRQCSLF